MAVENDKGVMVTGEEGRVGEVEGCGNGCAVVAEMGGWCGGWGGGL